MDAEAGAETLVVDDFVAEDFALEDFAVDDFSVADFGAPLYAALRFETEVLVLADAAGDAGAGV